MKLKRLIQKRLGSLDRVKVKVPVQGEQVVEVATQNHLM